MNNEDDDNLDDNDDSEQQPVPVYIVDDDTRALVEVALNCMVQLSQAQVDEEAAENLITIADALAERFDIDKAEVEEIVHTTDDGEEEIIYKPKGGLFNDDPEQE
jgi:hypothetical protein